MAYCASRHNMCEQALQASSKHCTGTNVMYVCDTHVGCPFSYSMMAMIYASASGEEVVMWASKVSLCAVNHTSLQPLSCRQYDPRQWQECMWNEGVEAEGEPCSQAARRKHWQKAMQSNLLSQLASLHGCAGCCCMYTLRMIKLVGFIGSGFHLLVG